MNNDSYDDILIASPFWNNGTGRVFFFFGEKDIELSSPDIIFEGENEHDYFGGQSGAFGDVNNDGYDDVIIGARGYGSSNYEFGSGGVNMYLGMGDGRVYIYYGGPDMDNVADIILDGEKNTQGWFGLTVSTEDIDKDGYVDILVGSQCYDQGRGRVYLFWGGETIDKNADLIFEGEGCNGKAFLYLGPFATEDLQDKIKAQQVVVSEVEQDLAPVKRELNDARKFIPSSTDLQEVFEGLPESLRRFLTPELEELHDETVASLADDSFVLRDGIRENTIEMTDIQLSPYIDELRQAIEELQSQDNRNDEQEEELETLKEKLSRFKGVKYVSQEERETRKNILKRK